jgi:hypothetical protein
LGKNKGRKPRAKDAQKTRKRQPATVVKSVREKRPIPSIQLADGHATLVWRFSMIDLEGKWGWGKFANGHADALTKKCGGWEGMREDEVFGKGGNKLIPADNMVLEASSRLTELELDDHGGLWELRLSGKPRIWGLRSGHIFYPVWWDPEHSVCPSKKKNN